MIVIGTRRKYQAPPPHIVFDALCDPDVDPSRPWLVLHDDERRPTVVAARRPDLIVWDSLWPGRPDARVRLQLLPGAGGTALRWTLEVDEPAPDDVTARHMRRRLNELINRDLRESFGQ